MSLKIGDKVKVIEPSNVNDDDVISTQLGEYATVWAIRRDSVFTIGVRLERDIFSELLSLWWFSEDELELMERSDE